MARENSPFELERCTNLGADLFSCPFSGFCCRSLKDIPVDFYLLAKELRRRKAIKDVAINQPESFSPRTDSVRGGIREFEVFPEVSGGVLEDELPYSSQPNNMRFEDNIISVVAKNEFDLGLFKIECACVEFRSPNPIQETRDINLVRDRQNIGASHFIGLSNKILNRLKTESSVEDVMSVCTIRGSFVPTYLFWASVLFTSTAPLAPVARIETLMYGSSLPPPYP
jgi:hypothetical protein